MRGRRPGEAGFTLIEVIVVIAVISILAAMAVPYAVKIIDQSREAATKKEMEDLYNTIIGDPKIPTAGYLGDRGSLPATLTVLNTRDAGGSDDGDARREVRMVRTVRERRVRRGRVPDGRVGNELRLEQPRRRADPQRRTGPGHRHGGRPDLPPLSGDLIGNLLVNLHVWDTTAGLYRLNPAAAQATAMGVTFYYSNNGSQASVAVTLPAAPPYSFNGYHAGLHAVTGTCTLVGSPGAATGQAVVYVPGNNQQAQVNLYLR